MCRSVTPSQPPLEHPPYTARLLRPGLWHIQDATAGHPPGQQPDGSFHSPSSVYVVEAPGRVLVFDLGPPYPGRALRALVDRIAGGRAVQVAITHNHFDHIGALSQFEDCPHYLPRHDPIRTAATGVLLSGGETIPLPPYRFQVLAVPGHTRGSLAFYEPEQGWLFTGDAFGSSYVWLLFLPGAVEVYRDTLRRTLAFLGAREDLLILPGHRYQQQILPVPGIDPRSPRNPRLGLPYLRDMLTLSEQILAGTAARPFQACGREDLAAYTYGRAEIDALLPGRPPVEL